MRKIKKVFSVLLAVLLVLPYISSTGIALDLTGGASGNGGSFYSIDPSTLKVKKLGDITGEDGYGSAVPLPAYNETVRVSVFLDEKSTADAGYSLQSLQKNRGASVYRESLKAKQDDIIKTAGKKLGHSLNVKWKLTLLANAISAEVKYYEIVKLSMIPGVKSVVLENRYDPEEAGVNTAGSSAQMVFAQSAWDAGYSGAGTRIAVIDTGIDTVHQSFDEDAFLHSIGEQTSGLMTSSQVSALAGDLNGSGTYLSAKIPFAYNYVDNNTTVNHLEDTQGEHGSHVAGIAAANKYIKQGDDYVLAASADAVHAVGMAPDAQIVVMKVFGASGGAYDSDYMAAIEDAIVLGCDACNLSLGSSTQGFTYDNEYQEILNRLSDGEENSGMVVSVSAGNSGAFADYLEAGDIYLDDIGMHTGGSPGTYINSLCTASADNVLSTSDTYITVSGTNFICYEDADGPVPLIKDFGSSQEVQFVYIDAYGSSSDYSTVNEKVSLDNKLVIVNRGGNITFADKGSNAASNCSPKALLVANNESGVIQMNIDGTSADFPMASITLAAANALKTVGTSHTAGSGSNAVVYYTGTLTLNGGAASIQQQNGTRATATISDFSSWGVPGSLLMKPEITAPGGDIWSVLGAHKTKNGTVGQSGSGLNHQYESMSGTSMAAPHIAGLAAIVAQYLKENNISVDGYSRRAVIQSLLMSTATPMKNGADFISILQQGAGLADVNSAVSASSVIFMTDAAGKTLTTATGAASDGKVKAEIGADPDRTGSYSYSFRIFNLSDRRLEFNAPSTDVFTQGYYSKGGEYYMDRGTVSAGSQTGCVWAPHGDGVTNPYDVNLDGVTDESDAQAVLDYLTGIVAGADIDLAAADTDEDGAVTSHDAHIILVYAGDHPAEYYIPEGGYADVTVTFSFAVDEDIYTAGAYIEGFTTVAEKADGEGVAGVTHTIPVLGFFGSFTDPGMFDTKSYTEDLYGSEQENYSGIDTTNYITLTYGGVEKKFSGNPYTVEDSFPSGRLAVRSDSQFKNIYYTLVRAAGTTGFALSRLDDEGNISEIISAAVNNADVTGMWFDQKEEEWKNASEKKFQAGFSAAASGLDEGDRFRIGYYALPEYYGMYYRMKNGGSLTDAASGVLNVAGFRSLLEDGGQIGSGGYVGYDFFVDDTAPRILSAARDGNNISISADDDRNLAYVAVLSLDGEVKYAETAPGAEAFAGSFDISSAVSEADGYVAVFVGDYAGNEAAVAVKVNDGTSGSDPYTVSSVSIIPGSLDLYKGNGADLIAKVSPLTATDRTVSWSTGDAAVATVDEFGHVTAVGPGTCQITARSNSNSAVSAVCSVKVTAVNKTLNGIIWDKLGSTHFASFNASDPSDWVSLNMRDDGDEIPLNTAFMNGSTLYAATLDVDSEEWEAVLYTVDRSTFELNEAGTCYVPATDIARAPSNYGDYMVYSYGPYLIFGNLLPEEDEEEGTYCGFPYGILDASKTDSFGDAYIAAVAAKSVSGSSADYYFLDDNGKIWQTTLTIGSQSIEFSAPAPVIDTGFSTMFVWQDLYYDGTYIYWGHTGDETEDWAKLIIIDPSTGAVYDAGDFGERVWPAGGFYVDGHDAPASSGETSGQMKLEGRGDTAATRDELNTAGVKERLAREAARIDAARKTRSSGTDDMPAADGVNVAEYPKGTPTASDVTGVITASREAEQTEEIVYSETVAVTNGYLTVTFDPDLLAFAGYASGNDGGRVSCNSETPGEVRIAYAFSVASGAGSPIVTLFFERSCTGGEVTIAPLEINNDFSVETIIVETLAGSGHTYGAPEWVWNDNYSEAELIFTCENDNSHKTRVPATVSSSFDATTFNAVFTATASGSECPDGIAHSETISIYVPHLKSASLTLEGKISVNYKFNSPDNVSYVVLTFNDSHTVVNVDDSIINDQGLYVASFSNIAAKQMTDKVILQFYDANDNLMMFRVGNRFATSYEYSVSDWANNKIASSSSDETTKNLAMALLNYGNAAQNYFHYKQDNPANPNGYLSEEMIAVQGDSAYAAYVSAEAKNAAGSISASLILESDTTLRFKFANAVTVYYDGVELEKHWNETEARYYVDINGIPAKRLNEMKTITVSDGINSGIVSYGPLTWATNKLSDEESAELAKSLYLYNKYAREYFNY
ncbi:MAG: S8 family serine peptidase [Lachnospiraceae bacterium]|nr:S8 family serine peptidase [Lachnospiraceae bacterium]